jgi:hypothetical protein
MSWGHLGAREHRHNDRELRLSHANRHAVGSNAANVTHSRPARQVEKADERQREHEDEQRRSADAPQHRSCAASRAL